MRRLGLDEQVLEPERMPVAAGVLAFDRTHQGEALPQVFAKLLQSPETDATVLALRVQLPKQVTGFAP